MDDSAQIKDRELEKLSQKVKNSTAPEELKETISTRLAQLDSLVASVSYLPEFDRISRYVEWVSKIPWQKQTEDKLDLAHALEVLDSHHHGLGEIKDRVIEYMAMMKLKKERGETTDLVARAPILFFIGLVGTGKTTIAPSIAEAMGRRFARIPFGGMEDPLDLRGKSKMHLEGEPGKVIRALIDSGSRNPVILLDEIDRVTDSGRSSIMGVLVELLDPKQNHAFVDHYIDYPVNLSQVLFIATANNTHKIATAVMDRLEPIQMPSYTDQEKIIIGQKYVLPQKLEIAGIPEGGLSFDENVWPQIVRPLGYDAGIRTLERTIDGIVRKVAKEIVEGKSTSVKITSENVKTYLPQ